MEYRSPFTPFTPEEFVRQVEFALPLSTAKEQKRLLEHARAWAVVTHQGEVPQELTRQIDNLEAQYVRN